MSKQAQELFKKEPEIGAVEAVKEGIQAVAPGLSLSKIVGDIGQELSHQAKAGAHEIASALFRGDAFVMYPKEGKEAESHGLSQEAHAKDEPQKEQERGGREM